MTLRAATATEPAGPGGDRRIIVMLGAPGAGKGTQAQRLAARLGLPHVSTGDLFRTAMRDGTELGARVRRYVERGALVPDELTAQVVEERLSRPDAADGAILDGFPRTRPQAEALDGMLAAKGERIVAALYVQVDIEALVERLAGRRVCTAPAQHVYHVVSQRPAVPGICDVDGSVLVQRDDDEPETVRARMERQLPPMYEVIDHYAEHRVLFAVPGGRSIDEVTEDLLRLVSAASRSR